MPRDDASEFRVRRQSHAEDRADLDRVPTVRPEVPGNQMANALVGPPPLGAVPGPYGDVSGPAPTIRSGAFPPSTPTSAFAFPLTFVDAAPPPGATPRRALLRGGRWVTVTKFCKCGPCHPQRDLTLQFDFLQAVYDSAPVGHSARRATDATVRFGPAGATSDSPARTTYYQWGGRPTFWNYIGVPPVGWTDNAMASRAVVGGLYGAVVSGFGMGVGNAASMGSGSTPVPGVGGLGGGVATDPRGNVANFFAGPGYLNHTFELYCDRSTYMLRHTMLAAPLMIPVSSGGTPVWGWLSLGYEILRRGIMRSCKPIRIEFPTIASWQSIDLTEVRFFGDFPRQRTSGLQRLPRYGVNATTGAGGFPTSAYGGDCVATSTGIRSGIEPWTWDPPFGVHAVTIVA